MKSDRTQIAHLFRRAGFGATPEELDDLTRRNVRTSMPALSTDTTREKAFRPM